MNVRRVNGKSGTSGVPWPTFLSRYERVLAAAEDFEEPALVAAEAELRRRLRATPTGEQAAIAARVREIETRVLGWGKGTDRTDESAPELRALGFSELAISESRRLR